MRSSGAGPIGSIPPYLPNTPGWALVEADSGADGSYASVTYEKLREGTQHPDRVIVGVNADATVPADELARCVG